MCRLPGVILATYGDLIRVPGSFSSLEREKAEGADIRIVYSTLDALEIAKKNGDKRIVFPGIGFETTTPSSAVALLEARRQKVSNFISSVYTNHALATLALLIRIRIDGYIVPSC
jgi:hydrogenase expression/formation protein HypD